MSTIQWWLSELGVEVNVGFVVVVVEVAFVLLEKHVQEMKEEERLRWLFFFEEMENLRFIVGVWRWVLSGNICVVEIVGEGERSSSMTSYVLKTESLCLYYMNKCNTREPLYRQR